MSSTPISHGPQRPNVATAPAGTTKHMGDFLQANDYISKFAFIILIVIVFIGLYHLGIMILKFLFGPKKDVYLTTGINDGSQFLMIPQDPNNSSAITVNRSVNEKQGISFTWSVWLYIKPHTTANKDLLHVFNKGNHNIPEDMDPQYNGYKTGMSWPNNAPGLYIDMSSSGLSQDGTNDKYVNGQYKLLVVMNTFDDIIETISVPDVPINKWVNVMIRCQQTSVDVYINGTVVKRQELGDVPKQNYGNVYVSANGGFNGYTSQLRYFGSALQPGAIMDIVKQGSGKTFSNKISGSATSSNNNSDPPYLSMRWYFDDNNIPPGGGPPPPTN